ncbi:MAG: hypothetical protein PHE67_03915 [Campylobacterales bacterium]|nr:hypothetical protein [Campylobacterales bacterium]
MARLLSIREIDALLEVEGRVPTDEYQDEIALHKSVYELFGTDGVGFTPPYTHSIEGYPKRKLAKLLKNIKSQLVLNIIHEDMKRYAKAQYEALTMRREDTYLQYIFDYDYEAWQSGREVAAHCNNEGKERRFVDSYIYTMHLSKTRYASDDELLAELRAIERDKIVPMHRLCDKGYPLESLSFKIDRLIRTIKRPISEYFYQKNLLKIYADMQNSTELEFCTARELIQKIDFLSQMGRRDGIHAVRDMYMGMEKLPIFANLYGAIIDGDFEQTLGRAKETYLEDMRQKLDFIVAWAADSDYAHPETTNPYATNTNKKCLADYTMDELVQKREFYRHICGTQGVLASERYSGDEKNSFLKALLDDYIVSGASLESTAKYAATEAKYRLAHYETLWEILEVGLGGLSDGDNPRTLHLRLMSFIPEGERWEFEYV